MDELKKALPGWILSLVVTLAVALFAFNSAYAKLEAKVDNNTETLKTKAGLAYVKAIDARTYNLDTKMQSGFESINNKLDRVYVILIEKK